MSEENLPGGNTDGAVRIGGVVRKRASPWTPTVHALLRHLEDADVDGVPRALGFDEQGRQILTYLPGEVIGDSIPWPLGGTSEASMTTFIRASPGALTSLTSRAERSRFRKRGCRRRCGPGFQ